uniref:WAP domain-containing protein n=1 Tax=Podarcis muralis TaxID=64176 RepID=A0A670IHQ2_PODMU
MEGGGSWAHLVLQSSPRSLSLPSPPPCLPPLHQPHLRELKAWLATARDHNIFSASSITMTPRNSSCFHHLLLVSLVGLLTASAHLIDTPGQNVTVAAEKAGTCPNATLGTARGNCTEECQSDASCAGTEKCCWTGCGASCRLPNGNTCPPLPPAILLPPGPSLRWASMPSS